MDKEKKRLQLTRRQFLKGALITGAAVGMGGANVLFRPGVANAAASSPQLAKWVQPLRGLGPTGIPVLNGTSPDPYFGAGTTYYQVTAGEFTDQLHPDLLPTRLWGYWDTTNPVKRHLGGVIITTRGTPSRIRFTNALNLTAEGAPFLKHIIPVDTTLPGANQAQNRVAIHLHGGLVPWTSDGGPFDWWAPNGASGLSFLNGPGGFLDNLYPAGKKMAVGQADYYYPNNQSTRLLWYHDHAHGITRVNAYAGLATGYLILDTAQETALASKVPSLASTIPIIVQDKVFVGPTTIATDPTWATYARDDVQSLGSLWYDHVYDPASFRLLTGGTYKTPPNPSCIPEFFGDTILVNGTVYPFLEVEPKAYRFLMLNACNARFLNLNLLEVDPNGEITTDPGTSYATNPKPGPAMVQIGTEGGYLVSEVYHPNTNPFSTATNTGNMLLGTAERSDFIIDFTGNENKEFILYNDAPGPFPGGPPTTDFYLGNPLNPVQPLAGTGPDTRQILKIKVKNVVPTTNEPHPNPSIPILDPTFMDPIPLVVYPTNVTPPISPLPIPAGVPVRDLTLNEGFDEYGRLKQMVGTTKPGLVAKGFGLDYLYPATEVVNKGAIEVWRIFNLTADTHPMHFHLVNVQILSRQPFQVVRGRFLQSGTARGPEPEELGWKETCKMHPGEVITVIMKFDLPVSPFNVPTSPRAASMGLTDPTKKYHEYVWHCHILEHEEHDMMRPLIVKEAI